MIIPLKSKNPVGFRLSIIDIVFLGLAGIATWLYPIGLFGEPELDSLIHGSIPFVVINFFLFCNVIRVRTRFELHWAASAILNMILFVYAYQTAWIFFLTQSLLTLITLIREIASKEYHGIFAKVKQ